MLSKHVRSTSLHVVIVVHSWVKINAAAVLKDLISCCDIMITVRLIGQIKNYQEFCGYFVSHTFNSMSLTLCINLLVRVNLCILLFYLYLI